LAYGLFAAQEKAMAAQEVALRFEALREVLVQRDAAGLTPLLETRIIEASELTLKRRASEAALEMQAGVLELNQLRGGAWTDGVRVEPLELSFREVPGMEDLLAAARTNNFELRMRRVELEQQGFEVSLARKGSQSGWSVGPYYTDQRAGDREQQIGISLSVPLPLWGGRRGRTDAAEARRQQAVTSLLVTQRDVERRVLEALMQYQARMLEMSKWREDAVAEFRRAAEVADRHYRLGAVPVATYVELQKQYLEAVEALLDTRHDALEAAHRVEHLTGVDLGVVRFEEGGSHD
jgi:cobalt-zinc-cadmium efflux system outer membrane protein